MVRSRGLLPALSLRRSGNQVRPLHLPQVRPAHPSYTRSSGWSESWSSPGIISLSPGGKAVSMTTRFQWHGTLASFTGGSGQMAVIAELLHRRCNAAIPHVDIGMDVFAFRDDREDVARIQVKTAPGTPYKSAGGYHARFGIPMAQLRRPDNPPLFYALAVRLAEGWGSFVVIGRAQLQELWNNGCGSENARSGDLELYIQFRLAHGEHGLGGEESGNEPKLRVRCGKFDLTGYMNAWESLPPLKSLADIRPETHHD